MEHFVIIVNGWKPLTIITKSSILDVAAVLDSPLKLVEVDLDSEIEIVNEISSEFCDLKPEAKVIFWKDYHDVIGVIIEFENWHNKHIRLNPIIVYT